jgi:hypothetical protein
MGAARKPVSPVVVICCVLASWLVWACAPAFASAPEVSGVTVETPVGSTTAQVHGVLNQKGAGEAGSYEFLYRQGGQGCSEGSKAPEPAGMMLGLADEEVSETLTGLHPGSEYSICLRAENASAQATEGPLATFSTAAAAPSIDTESTTELETDGATLQAQVNPNDQKTTYYFEYSTQAKGETLEGSVTKLDGGAPLTGEFGDQLASVATGATLTPGTVYYFRVVASNGTPPASKGKVESFTTPEAPVTESAVAQGSSTVLLAGELNPGGASGKVTYQFDYSNSGTCAGAGVEHTSPVEMSEAKQLHVSGEAKELEANAEYKFCLVATNAYGGQAVSNEVSAHTAPHAPKVAAASVTEITSGAATVGTQIYPYGEPTSYHVGYGTTTAYGSSTPEVSAGAGAAAVSVQTRLEGLTPNTEYHYRVVASNGAGSENTADATFTTGAAAIVAPSSFGERVDELVTPAGESSEQETHRQLLYWSPDYIDGIASNFGAFQAARDGEAVAYMTSPVPGGSGDEESSLGGDQQVASRGPEGHWTQVLDEPEGVPFHEPNETQAFSPNLTAGIFSSYCSVCGLTGILPDKDAQLYKQPGVTDSYAPASTYEPLITTTPPYREGGYANGFGAFEVGYAVTTNPVSNDNGRRPVFAGASADYSEVLFEANDKLTENAAGGPGEDPRTHLRYAEENNLYVSAHGGLGLVNVLPDGSTEANATFGALPFGNEAAKNLPDFSNVISSDGSKVFWTNLNTGDLYVRENPTQPQSPLVGGKCTVAADACTILIAEDARFWTATLDGAKAFYVKEGGLYEYDLESAQRTELSEGAEVEGVLGASEDGSYVYYAAEGGKLYLSHDDGQKPQFIAAVSKEDGTAAPFYKHSESGVIEHEETGDWTPGLGQRTAEVTPDGRALVFVSKESLTRYNNEGLPEVYVYESEAGAGGAHLFCSSCAPSGEAPKFIANGELAPEGHLGIPGSTLPLSYKDTFQANAISEDGSEVFFESTEPLVPQATDESMNVYEWQRYGTHGCELKGGCVSLLSGGESPSASWLIGASADGSNIFMITRAKLAPEDTSELYEVYDARVEGQRPVAPVCTGTGCQGLPAPPPVFATPASFTYEGVGNFAPSVVKTTIKAEPKSLTRKQKLVKSLKACAKDKPRHKRSLCEARARRLYGAKSKATKSSAKGRS